MVEAAPVKPMVRPARALTRDDMLLMRIPERYWGATFDGITEGEHKNIVAGYLHRLHEALSKGVGLLFWGDNDTGKTSCAVVIAKHARRWGYTTLFIEAENLRRADVANQWWDPARTMTVWQRASTVDVLLLDDLGKEQHPASGYLAGHAASMMETLIRARSNALKATLITTNVNPGRLVSKQDDDEDTALYKKSMASILKGTVYPVPVNGPKRREAEMLDFSKMLTAPDDAIKAEPEEPPAPVQHTGRKPAAKKKR